jgi:hypothetical protein
MYTLQKTLSMGKPALQASLTALYATLSTILVTTSSKAVGHISLLGIFGCVSEEIRFFASILALIQYGREYSPPIYSVFLPLLHRFHDDDLNITGIG